MITILKKELSKETINQLALVAAGKANEDSNIEEVSLQVLENYNKSIEFFSKLNDEYKKANPKKLKVVKKPTGY